MGSRNVVLVPQTPHIEVRLEPSHAQVESLYMLNNVVDFPGLNSWLVDLSTTISPTRRYNNKLVFAVFGAVFEYFDESWPDLVALADFLQTQDPVMLRDRVFTDVCDFALKEARHNHLSTEIPAPEELLTSVDAYVNFMGGLYAAKNKTFETKIFREAHELLQDPNGMMALVVFHLRDMWYSAMAEEWARMQPVMQASVEALQNVDYRGMSAVEAGRIITGRDLTLSFGEHLERGSHIIFSPTPHCGPYVSLGQGKTLSRVFFRPRLPEGSKTKSIEMDRSDLMVRLSALADDTRLRILELFTQHEELCAPDVMQLLDLSQSAASRHLRQLTATGYLTERRREVTKCYSLNRARIEGTLQSLKSFLLQS